VYEQKSSIGGLIMKKILTTLFFITLILSAQNLFAAPGWSGTGTSGDPYLITSMSDLALLATNTNAGANYSGVFFKQTLPIVLSGEWTPIGNDTHEFAGIYHGNGQTVTGLTISAGGGFSGLFGYMVGSTIDNLGVTGSVTGDNHVGLLSGGSDACAISGCYSSGSVTVTGAAGIGGGLVGSSVHNGAFSNCYSTASVSAGVNWEIGGFIGVIFGTNSFTNCYSIGVVTSTHPGGGYTGGILGHDYVVSSTFTSCYWNTTTSGMATGVGDAGAGNTPTGMTGEVTANMKLPATFVGWSGTVWVIDAGFNGGYPALLWQNSGGTPMPVELTSFTSAVSKSGVTLKWSTATEVNNYGFNIERRAVTSAGSWTKIGFVAGHGTSNSVLSYSYADAGLASGRYAYRLKQIDNGGAFKYSQSIEVEAVNLTPAVIGLSQNYPNPFNPNTQITFSVASTEQAKLVVYNILGQPVVTLFEGIAIGQQSYKLSFDASNLATGVYFYKLETPSRTDVRRMQLLK
jgi:hypothetical protein